MDKFEKGKFMQGPDYLEKSPPKTYALSLYQSGNEAFFFWEEQLLFHFKVSLHIKSREINNLLQSKAIIDLMDIRETRHLGWEVIKTGDHTSLSREGYTLFTKVKPSPGHEINIPQALAGLWKPGYALVDHANSRIYISSFNRIQAVS